MKKVLLSLAAVTAIAAAAPAAAQPYGNAWGYHAHNQQAISRQIDPRPALLTQRVDRVIERGRVSRWEARSLVNQVREFRQVERDYRRGGLTIYEAQRLDARLDRLEHDIRQMRGEGNRYSLGYGRW